MVGREYLLVSKLNLRGTILGLGVHVNDRSVACDLPAFGNDLLLEAAGAVQLLVLLALRHLLFRLEQSTPSRR